MSALPTVAQDRRTALVDRVLEAVCSVFPGVISDEVKSRERTQSTALARHVAFYVFWRVFNWSSPETGRAFGVDHSTVLYGRTKVQRLVGSDLQFGADVERVILRLRGAS